MNSINQKYNLSDPESIPCKLSKLLKEDMRELSDLLIITTSKFDAFIVGLNSEIKKSTLRLNEINSTFVKDQIDYINTFDNKITALINEDAEAFKKSLVLFKSNSLGLENITADMLSLNNCGAALMLLFTQLIEISSKLQTTNQINNFASTLETVQMSLMHCLDNLSSTVMKVNEESKFSAANIDNLDLTSLNKKAKIQFYLYHLKMLDHTIIGLKTGLKLLD